MQPPTSDDLESTDPSIELDLAQQPSTQEPKASLRSLAWVFAKLGATAFGGPAAHIALMNDEVAKRRNWLTQQKFLDILGINNLIPGPNSTEMAIHIGLEQRGWQGLLVAGLSFILPATFMVWGLAIIYSHYQTRVEIGWLMYGIKPVIIAIILQAIWRLRLAALKNLPTILTSLVVIALSVVGWNEIILLLSSGLIVMLVNNWQRWRHRDLSGLLLLPSSQVLVFATAKVGVVAEPVTWISLFWVFLKIGSVLYGSGYVLFAFLQSDLVERYHWLTSQQLLDAIAIGQFTPGPVSTTATFIGYLLGGNLGAIAATVGIFLPAFIAVAAVKPLVTWLRDSAWAASFLDGVNAASLALMAFVTWELGTASIIDWLTGSLALVSFIIVTRWQKINSVWLILAGGTVGLLIHP